MQRHPLSKRFTAMCEPLITTWQEGDTKVLKKHCSNEIIAVCKAQHQAFDSEGIVFDNKILHISDMEVQEKKMMEGGPIIILRVHCIRDKLGSIIEGGKVCINIPFCCLLLFSWSCISYSIAMISCIIYPTSLYQIAFISMVKVSFFYVTSVVFIRKSALLDVN
ncbi:mitochondrial import inner membrane translocase subunit TIM44-2 isoform X2 [Capsicum annuum]|uniref:mitochondrial import inner membrane translocase subunit TIM44-2 isoform X2 n=1 Tax=Capsicum annuum TaxID=4072 RepID=UPI001FB06D90|nr:mitochondrial import inner membrane translocase subunit TIM44-2 isoform X2 [Capsicum annuum]